MSFAGKVTAIAIVVGAVVVALSLLPERARSGTSAVAASRATMQDSSTGPTHAVVADAERNREGASRVETPPPTAAKPVTLPPRDPERWRDVTMETWQGLVRDDEGAAMRAVIAGLEAETLDLAALLKFIDDSFADSIVVPGSSETKAGASKTSVGWVQVYVNDQGARSVALPNWSRNDMKSETAGMSLPANSWAAEKSAGLGIASKDLRPWFRILLHRSESGRRTGSVALDPGPAGDDRKQSISKLKQLEHEGRLPSTLSYDFDDRGGRRTWMRSGSSQELTAFERERLDALFDRLADSGKGFAGLK